jgi:ankyrin repeat protein
MHLACRQGLHEAAASLLKASADVNANDNENDTPLHVAAVAGNLANFQRRASVWNERKLHRFAG